MDEKCRKRVRMRDRERQIQRERNRQTVIRRGCKMFGYRQVSYWTLDLIKVLRKVLDCIGAS